MRWSATLRRKWWSSFMKRTWGAFLILASTTKASQRPGKSLCKATWAHTSSNLPRVTCVEVGGPTEQCGGTDGNLRGWYAGGFWKHVAPPASWKCTSSEHWHRCGRRKIGSLLCTKKTWFLAQWWQVFNLSSYLKEEIKVSGVFLSYPTKPTLEGRGGERGPSCGAKSTFASTACDEEKPSWPRQASLTTEPNRVEGTERLPFRNRQWRTLQSCTMEGALVVSFMTRWIKPVQECAPSPSYTNGVESCRETSHITERKEESTIQKLWPT